MVRLRLYIAGQTPPELTALSTVQKLRESMPGVVEVEIVDVLEDPATAEEARVLTTPTLDRVEPWPTRRIIGDLGDLDRITETFELEVDNDGGRISVTDRGWVSVTGDTDIASHPTVGLDPDELPD